MENANDIFRYGAEQAGVNYHSGSAAAVMALERLMLGNQHYCVAQSNPAALSAEIRREMAEKGQNPYVILLTCSDSRVPTAHIFSESMGALFVIRNAGNLVGQHTLTSAVYGAEHLHCPLLLVMGHTKCGAISAALHDKPESGMVAELIHEVLDALGEERDPQRAVLVNVRHSLRKLGACAEIRRLVEQGELALAAAIYDIESGECIFLDDNTVAELGLAD